MPFADLELIVFNNVEGALDTSCIGTELYLTLLEVAHDRDLPLDATVTAKGLEIREEPIGITRQTNPVAIHEDFRHLLVTQVLRCELLELLHAPILQLVDHIA